MFDRVVLKLLAGEFICQVTDREAFHRLEDAAFADEVDDYLSRINLKLVRTERGGAFYVDRTDMDSEGRRGAAALFKEVQKTFRPAVEFFRLVLRAGGAHGQLEVGAPLSVAQMTSTVVSSAALEPAFRDLVARVGTGAAATDATRMERVFDFMRSHGYVAEANKEKGLYLVTGKLQYLEMLIDYVVEHAQLKDEGPQDAQETLL